jgi:hypothetical protein
MNQVALQTEVPLVSEQGMTCFPWTEKHLRVGQCVGVLSVVEFPLERLSCTYIHFKLVLDKLYQITAHYNMSQAPFFPKQ